MKMKITNMNRNQLASYAAQMRDRSRGLDRIMGELKAERAENRRLKKEIAKPGAAEKIEGVFEVGDQVDVVWPLWTGKTAGDILKTDEDENYWVNGRWFSATWLRHASPATSPCQSCAAKDAEIEKLESVRDDLIEQCGSLQVEFQQMKTNMDREIKANTFVHSELSETRAQIETQRANSADTQRNLERAREIIGHHEASILRVTAELTAALGGGA